MENREESVATNHFIGNEDYVNTAEAESWQKDIFEQAKPGTVLYCDMPLEKKKLDRVPIGHRARPYVIVKKGEKNVYGYACATHPHSSIGYDQLFKLENFAYQKDIQKYVDSFIQLDKPFRIPISNILDSFYELDEKTMFDIELQIRALEQRRNVRLMRFNLLMCENKMEIAQIGDVILYKNQYYFVDEIKKKKYFVLMPIVRQNKLSSMYFDVTDYLEKDKNYVVNVDKNAYITVQFSESNKIQIVKRCLGDICKRVNEAKRKYRKKLKNQSTKVQVFFEFGDILENKGDHTKYVFIVSYQNASYALAMEDYECGIANVIKIKPTLMNKKETIFSNVDAVNSECLKECIFQLKKELGKDFWNCKSVKNILDTLGVRKKQSFLNIHQIYPIGTILSQKFSECEYIYLFSYKKSTYMLSMEEAIEGVAYPINIKLLNFEPVDELTDEAVYDLLRDITDSKTVKDNDEIRNYVDKCMKDIMSQIQSVKFN